MPLVKAVRHISYLGVEGGFLLLTTGSVFVALEATRHLGYEEGNKEEGSGAV